MQQTQINIYNGRKAFRYGIEYVDNTESVDADEFYFTISQNQDLNTQEIQFLSNFYSGYNYKRNTNVWLPLNEAYFEEEDIYNVSELNLNKVNLSSVNIYFPSFSVETYTGNWKYIFSANIYINGDKITLCEVLLDRRDAISYPGKKVMHNIKYSEYINVVFPDPWDITYSDEWAPFRQVVCNEPENINNTGSILSLEIHPVTESENSENMVKLNNYLGGMNSLLLSEEKNITLYNLIDYNSSKGIDLSLHYNDNLYNSFEEYLIETYNLDQDSQFTVSSTLSLYDNENIYNVYGPVYGSNVQFSDIKRPEDNYTTKTFESWEEFTPGLQFKAITNILLNNEEFLSLISNSLQVDQYAFAKFIEKDNSVDLDSIKQLLDTDTNIEETLRNMETVNIVNKTIKNVINVEKPNDFKNSLTRPVFIRTYQNSDIVVHPGVTENIALNLREYKNYIEGFTIRIADVEFPEYGRQGSNIIFKIVGKQLPEEIAEGNYYILDDNKELVTSGKYILG